MTFFIGTIQLETAKEKWVPRPTKFSPLFQLPIGDFGVSGSGPFPRMVGRSGGGGFLTRAESSFGSGLVKELEPGRRIPHTVS
jgi:hypothetical protein